MPDMTEPPELLNRDGEKIAVFRNSDGSFFSNHPDYPMALAMHEQRVAMEAEAKAKADAEAVTVVDDEAVEPDNNDGVLDYEEMNSKDLVALAKERDLQVPSGTRRSQVIALLQADDEAKAAK